jgi:hypothetical protein
MDELIKTLKSLIADIEAMQGKDRYWFGDFSDWEETPNGAMIEWPNLAISLGDVKMALSTIEGEAK